MGRLAFPVRAEEDESPRRRDTHRTGAGWRTRIGTFAATAAMVSAGIVLGAQPAAAAPAPIKLTSASCPAEIVQGQTSGCVTELQNLLNAHGAGLMVDGQFGAGTLYAVREYQAATAIAVDGRVGSATKSKLYATGGSAPAPVNLNSASCPANIVQGAKGGCVTELQRLLRHQGYAVDVDGDFGAGTASAVRSFQSSRSLTADGQVGAATKRALYDTDESPSTGLDLRSSSCPENIVEGQSGGCVATLQSLLNGKGQSLDVDASFGPATLAAVKAFQSASGLTADGAVGPNTKTALYANIGGGGGNGAPAPVNLNSASCPNEIAQGQRSGCVTELQSLLNHHGADLAVDGDFGALTDSAVRDFQAEKGLSVDGHAGPNTKAALYGAVTPPSSPPPGGGYSKILDVAEAEVGTAEGSARANSYGSAVGLSLSTSNYAWCATFTSWVAKQTGASSYRNSYVSGWVKQARAGNYHLSVTTSPQPGDIVAYDWDGGSDFTGGNEHIGIVRTISGTSFTAVEGNTGNPNGSNDGVYIRSRATNSNYDVVFIRVR
ncbi:peptidoglycan hydrolase-like protein with peptidoglycan-binding domain [Streptomyces sp. V3I8]|uniref:peptidoglycan-binding protein n=1 Tax=Streptomyces sp. V3I8 TaxID=3042279 RepID=UPI002786DF96|nr:peptidoglycan-binding protein [Streptomyces sp. V3I8]MDQ1038416.1 peptidoglycan hydrolase-like protein with peptidoglycan-binding domain [Streptomyces sp. V3I8]